MELDDEELWSIFDRRNLGRDRREQRANQRIKDMQDHGHQAPRRVRSLSRDEIVKTAIKVADAEGAQAISMRRIARELNAGAMSLYWHVSSKDELLDFMLDAVEGEEEFPPVTGDWRTDLTAAAWTQRTALRRHEWLMDFIGGRPPLGPNTLRNLERSLATIDSLGLDMVTALNVLGTLATYVMGAVLREFREMGVERRDREAAGGLTEDDLHKIVHDHVQKLRGTGRFPHFTRMYEEGIDPDSAETRDARFEFGLRCVLDGIAARLPGQPG
ncbi:MAG TPA: TetR/AcrR family transcriptional regulator [Streptosporangiaceae bacterium]|jgi:AcrR family transcriptional regulator|nr:TetR/AcrR family transcriptional regulator [Streptosporangiaceae bacterium]